MTAATGGRIEEAPQREISDAGVPAAPSGHRPHLDGIRVVAVYLVVAFHAGSDRFSGGFIGVDVFFVLSGYLVTGLLLRDLRANGRIRLARFYSRRFRRLLPAAFVTLLVTGAVFTAVASPVEITDALRSIKAAFLYFTNWFFIRESSDYFAANIDASPVVHFWSLAIEEQFYLIWPLALGGLYWVTRRAGAAQWRTIRVVILVAGVASALFALRISGTDLNRAYYGTDTRAYQLLAGAFVALTPRLAGTASRHRRPSRLASIAAIASIGVLASWLIDLNPIRRGIVVTILTCIVLVSLEAAGGGLARRALSLGPVAYLGRISYGTYLWHWPIIVIANQVFEMSPVSLFLLTCLAATGIASLSYQVLEGPVRASPFLNRYRSPVIVAGLTLSLLGALVFAPAILRDNRKANAAAVSTEVSGVAPVPAGIDWDAVLKDRPAPPDCLNREPSWCTIVKGSGEHILLMGDSHAGMLVPAFTALAEKRGDRFSVAIKNTCPWQESLTFAGPLERQACLDHKADWEKRVIPALDPDVIVLAGRTFDDPTNTVSLQTEAGPVVRRGEPGYEAAIRAATATTVDHFLRDGRKVVIVEPIPYPKDEDDPLRCLSKATFLDECRYVASPGPLPAERIYRDLAKQDEGVWTLDMDKLVCPYLPICDPMVDGMVVKHDEGHITATYSRSLSDEIEAFLAANRIIG